MKERPKYFLSEKEIDHDSEVFDYIQELHDYLWEFVKCEIPSASGSLNQCVDIALKERRRKLNKH